MDVVIDKPANLQGYALHRIVEQYQNGVPALWADEGTRLRIRPTNSKPPAYEAGNLLGFTLTACVEFKSGGKHRYLPLSDWQGRREWLEKKAAKHGFEILGVHVSPKMRNIEAHDGRTFRIDATEFVGLLRVIDSELFGNCLVSGVGKVGKAFGLNLLIVQ